jgi:hypothetical protein
MSAREEYNLGLLRRYAWPGLTPRQRHRLWRLDPLLYATVRGLAEELVSVPQEGNKR